MRKWRAANPDKVRDATARRSPATREKQARWHKDNVDKSRAKDRRRRARKLGAEGSHTGDQWTRLKAFYGNVCLCCGVHDSVKTLAADHVIPLSKGGSDYITNIQPLCQSCNSRKRTLDTDYRQVCLLETA